jgi:hypothetical protein
VEDAETVYFNDSALEARQHVEAVLGRWVGVLGRLDEAEKAKLQRSMGLKMEQLKARPGSGAGGQGLGANPAPAGPSRWSSSGRAAAADWHACSATWRHAAQGSAGAEPRAPAAPSLPPSATCRAVGARQREPPRAWRLRRRS